MDQLVEVKVVLQQEKKYYCVRIFYSDEPLDLFQRYLLEDCAEFYIEEILGEILIPLINQTHKISLRSLEWLLTNFSKKRPIICKKKQPLGNHNEWISINESYQAMLRKYHRKKFDPFRRRKRIYVKYHDNFYETTVAQLVCIKWCYIFGVLDYSINNLDRINEDMSLHGGKRRKRSREEDGIESVRKKRKELSKKHGMQCVLYEMEHSYFIDDLTKK